MALPLVVLLLLLAACGDGTDTSDERWTLEGPLLAWDGDVWIVEAVPVVVPEDMTWDGNLVLGSIVTATGLYDSAGRRIAETVSLRPGPLPEATLPETSMTGAIEEVIGDTWIVDGVDVLVPSGTAIHAAEAGADVTALIAPGVVAEIAGHRLDDDRIVAHEVTLRRPTSKPEPPAGDDDAASEEAPTTPPAEVDDGDDGDGDGRDDDSDDEQGNDDDEGHGEQPNQDSKPDKPDKSEKPEKSKHDRGSDRGINDDRKPGD